MQHSYAYVRLPLVATVAIVALLATIFFVPAGSNGPNAQSDGPPVIRLGHFPNVTHAQAVIAHHTGRFDEALGGRIDWTLFNAGPTAIEALFAGDIDATFIGPNPAINGYIKSKGESFVIISGAASGGAALVIAPHSHIQSPSDFAGKTIATPQLGNTQDVAARVWLAEQGHKTIEAGGSLTIQPLANPDQLTLFHKKQIDGAWTIEPWVSRLEQEAGGKIFLDEAALWPEERYVTTHLIVRRDFLAKHPDVVRKLVDAHIALTLEINADKTKAARLLNEALKQQIGKPLPEAVITAALKRVEFTWDPIASSLHTSAEDAHAIGFIKQPPELDGIYDLAILNRLLRQRGLGEVEGGARSSQ